MALTSTIYKVQLQLSDLDRNRFGNHALTLARHPSETEQRLMVRLLAFALNAEEGLEFCRGLSNDDEPALWQHDMSGRLLHWIELGQPDPVRLRRACGRADRVSLYCYGGRAVEPWWRNNQDAMAKLERLAIVNIPGDQVDALASLAARSMSLNCTVQDGLIWLDDGATTLEITPLVLQERAA